MKHIKTKLFFLLLFISNVISSMDILQAKKKSSPATKAALNAITNDSVNSLKAALSQGADISCVTKNGNTLLLSATQRQKKKTSLYLSIQPYFQNDLIINHQNFAGKTVLMEAAFHGYKKIVKKILKIKNIGLDLQDMNGDFALHFAVRKGHNDITRLLVEHGANPTIQDNNGITIAFYKNVLDNHNLDSAIIKKIIYARDAHENTQLHLLATADIESMIKTNNQSISANDLFFMIVENLIQHGVSIWSMNDNNMLAVETAYERYCALHQQYTKNPRIYLMNTLNSQEKILHLLLLYYLKQTQNKPISMLPSPYTCGLNIETVMAQKHANNENYYQNYSIDTKNKLKRKLWINQTQIPIVWVSPAYAGPSIINEYGDTNYNSLK